MMEIIPVALAIAAIFIFLYKKKTEERLERDSLEKEKKEIMKTFLSNPTDLKPKYTKEQIINFAERLKEMLIKKYKLSSNASYEEVTSLLRNLPLDLELKAILIDFFIRVPKLKFASESIAKKELEKLRENAYYIENNLKELGISKANP